MVDSHPLESIVDLGFASVYNVSSGVISYDVTPKNVIFK